MPPPTKLSPNLWLAAYALSVPLALGVFATWDSLRTLKDAPAWLQAIGSVAAIVAAIVIDQGASRRQRQLKDEEDQRQDRARRDTVILALDKLTAARNYLDRQATLALEHGTIYATQTQILAHAQQLQRVEYLAKHYLGVGTGSARVMSALAVVVPEVMACISLLLALAQARSLAQLLAAQTRVNVATDAVDDALGEAFG